MTSDASNWQYTSKQTTAVIAVIVARLQTHKPFFWVE